MIIALDYDSTYTADKTLWDTFIMNARGSGHQVMVVTMRHLGEAEPVNLDLAGKVDRIILTSRKAKKSITDLLGIEIDIWIDDAPYMIYHDDPSTDKKHA